MLNFTVLIFLVYIENPFDSKLLPLCYIALFWDCVLVNKKLFASNAAFFDGMPPDPPHDPLSKVTVLALNLYFFRFLFCLKLVFTGFDRPTKIYRRACTKYWIT